MKRSIEIAATGRNVATNIVRLRTARGMSLRALSAALSEAGRDLSPDAINRIENGAKPDAAHVRRVDVDDLAAFAHVLGAAPEHLLTAPDRLEIKVQVSHSGDAR